MTHRQFGGINLMKSLHASKSQEKRIAWASSSSPNEAKTPFRCLTFRYSSGDRFRCEIESIRFVKMSLVLRFRQHLSVRLSQTSSRLSLLSLSRSFAQAAIKEEEEEEEIDQRKLPTDYDPLTFDPTEHRSPPTDRVFRLVDEISSLTLSEISELGAIIMKKNGMTELPTVTVMNPGAGIVAGGAGQAHSGANEEAKVVKTVFEIKLEGFDASAKIKIIKEVRSFTDLGLKEAKELVEKTPSVLKGGLSKEDGEKLLEKLKAIGAKVVLE